MMHWFSEDSPRWRRMARKGGGGGGTTTTQTIQDNSPWSAQQEPLKFGFQEARNIYDSNSPTYFGGNTVAGFNPTQQTAMNMTTNRALNGNPLNQAAQGEASRTLSGSYLTPGNPYMSNLTQAIDAQVRPMVDARFSGSGRFGSAGHAGAYSSALANAIAPQMFNSYEAERGRMGATMAQAPSLAQADYYDIGQLGQVGLQQQQQSQADINAAIEKHNFEQNAQANKLSDYMGLIGGGYGGSNNTVQTAPGPGKGGAFQNAAMGTSALANTAMAASLFASDIRLKKDIKRVGTLDSGIPVYTFRYNWGGPEQTGVMAQDVEKVIPEAVAEINGIKMVDYGRLH